MSRLEQSRRQASARTRVCRPATTVRSVHGRHLPTRELVDPRAPTSPSGSRLRAKRCSVEAELCRRRGACVQDFALARPERVRAQPNDHLVGSLPRGGGGSGVVSWCVGESAANGDCSPTAESASQDTLIDRVAEQIASVGDQGCGWEAVLESWYRFLVEPAPWTDVVRQNCPFVGDTSELCVGPATDGAGNPLVDGELLSQRQRFLRADSVLLVVMLSDENDCSFSATGQSWRLSETRTPLPDGSGDVANRAYRASAACETNPNDPCCLSFIVRRRVAMLMASTGVGSLETGIPRRVS